jgi:single-strand DNA-binding protein
MSKFRMPTLNSVTVSGRITNEPAITYTESGHARLILRLAHNRPYKDRNGEWQEETSYFTATCWNAQAEHYGTRVYKGAPVLATGRLRSWATDEKGHHAGVEISVKNLQVLNAGASAETDEEELSEVMG